MNAAPPKILFIGLDAADPGLINHWAGQGLMPTWSRLLASGLSSETEGPIGFYIGSIWPSFYTAVNPARHGAHCWEQITPGSYDVRRYLAGAHVSCEAFWTALSRAGRRTAIVDVPLSGPDPTVNGLQVIEWGCHDSDLGFLTVPTTLAAEIVQEFGLHPIQGNCNGDRSTAEDFIAFRDDLLRGTKTKLALSEQLVQREPWDLFLTIFSEAHCGGHQCWHLHDPGHPRHDPQVASRVGDPVRDVYMALDRAVGKLIERAGPDTRVIVWASHGMGPHYNGTFMLDEILLRLEIADATLTDRRLLTLASKLFPPRWTGALQRRYERKLQSLRAALDRTHRKFFDHPNNQQEGGIRINLAGREPQGIVQPGADFERVCEQLTKDLLALVDVAGNRPLVRRVVRTRELYDGEFIDHLPDLVVQWNEDFQIRNARSPKFGDVYGDSKTCRTGGHRPIGQFIALGPGIKPGRIERRVSVMDFAPTLARLLGVQLDGVDGKPIPEIAG